MLPLIRMAWTLNRRMLLALAPAFAFMLWVAILGQSRGLAQNVLVAGLGCATMLASVVAFQGLASAGEDFLLALPVAPAQVVHARYLSSLAAVALGLALPLAAVSLARLAAPARIPALGADILGIAGLLGLGFAAALGTFFPFVFHFGAPRGPIVFSSLMGLGVLPVILFDAADTVARRVIELGDRALDSRPFALALAAGVLLLCAASQTFSAWTYGRRGAR